MNPTQIQDCIDLAYQVVRRNHRRKIKRIKELTCPSFFRLIIDRSPFPSNQTKGITLPQSAQSEFYNTLG